MIAYCINARLYSILTDFFFLAMLKSENNIFTLYKDLNCYLRDPNVGYSCSCCPHSQCEVLSSPLAAGRVESQRQVIFVVLFCQALDQSLPGVPLLTKIKVKHCY